MYDGAFQKVKCQIWTMLNFHAAVHTMNEQTLFKLQEIY